LIITILTNFKGKSGAKNQGAAKEKMEIRKIKIFRGAPPQLTGGLKSRSGGRKNYFDNQ
jgi:hypothetical protein